MNASSRTVRAVLLIFMAVGVLMCAGCTTMAAHGTETAKLELQLDSNEVKVVSVSVGQTLMEVLDLCKPAKFYVDDDPWFQYPAAGGGSYVLFFSPADTRGPYGTQRDTLYLYAVARYLTAECGLFLLPDAMRDKACGEFVTLSVALSSDERRVASVALGMSTRDVMRLFEPAHDHADGERFILYNSAHGGRHLLIFSPKDDSNSHHSQHDKLSEVIYHPGGQEEAFFRLPRRKRGQSLPAAYMTLLGSSESRTTPSKPDAGDGK